MLLQDELWVIANVCLVGTALYVKELDIAVGTRLSGEICTGKTTPNAILKVTCRQNYGWIPLFFEIPDGFPVTVWRKADTGVTEGNFSPE